MEKIGLISSDRRFSLMRPSYIIVLALLLFITLLHGLREVATTQAASNSENWDGEGVWAMSVILDGGVYKMWYTGFNSGVGSGNQIGYATSPDGVNWIKYPGNPVIGLGEPGDWDEYAAGQPYVMKDGGVYKIWYWCWGNGYGQICYATSLDGINWTKNPNPVVPVGPEGSWDSAEIGGPSVLFDGLTYHMWYHGQNGPCCDNLQIGYANSTDGITWIKHPTPVLTWSTPDNWDDDFVSEPSVIMLNDTYYMWYLGNDGTGIHQTGLATSTNGISWIKHPDPVLPIGDSGSWDEKSAAWPSVITGSLQMWYAGMNTADYFQIGYATSLDGIIWTKSLRNPILKPGTFRIFLPLILKN